MNIRILVAAFAVATIVTVHARADDEATWLSARQAAFSQWKAAHPKLDSEIDAVKMKTATAVRALPPLDQSKLDQPPSIQRVPGVLSELWDDSAAPQMIVIPAGEYTMGSPSNEPDRKDREGPLHRVRIAYPFAVGKYDVSVGEFGRFMAESGYIGGNECFTFEEGKMANRPDRNWNNPAVQQNLTHPVICINWADAQAYAAWLSKKTGHTYRLLSESEFEYVNRAGSTTIFWWGNEIGKNHANCDGCGSQWDNKQTSPVGSFPPNAFGLFDTSGNVWSHIQDCWTDNFNGAPVDGSAINPSQCGMRVLRGGAWNFVPKNLRAASRDGKSDVADRSIFNGFRLARTL